MRLILLFLIFVKPFSTNVLAQRAHTIECVTVLRKVLNEQPEWIKVHAAEYLIWAGYPQGVKEMFLKENEKFGMQSPYRIGVWRVLAQAATSEAERKIWTKKIKKAFLDPDGADRVHAAETLAKLKISPLEDNPELTRTTLNSTIKPLALYTLWSVAFTSEPDFQHSKSKFISLLSDPLEKENAVKTIAAYATRQLGNVKLSDWDILAKIALDEPAQSPAKAYLLSAAFVTCLAENEKGKNRLTLIRDSLLKYKISKSKAERSEMAMALAEKGTTKDLPVLISLLNNEGPLESEADNEDVKAAAAYAVLRIEKGKY